MKKLLIASLVGLSGLAMAATSLDSGVYVGAGVGYGKMNFKFNSAIKAKDKSGIAWNLNAGYKINKNLKVAIADVIGKNWFDAFIDNVDNEKVFKVFKDLLNNQTDKWKTYKNDIRFTTGQHKFINFTNKIMIRDGEKFISSFGVEYMDNM